MRTRERRETKAFRGRMQTMAKREKRQRWQVPACVMEAVGKDSY
jgi:hypothetical protein